MENLYLAMPIKYFNDKDRSKNKVNIHNYKNIVKKLKEKYKNTFKIHEDIELMEMFDITDTLAVSLILAMGATSDDGLILPTNYKEFQECVELRDMAILSDMEIYIFNEQTLTITKEGEQPKYESKITTNSCCEYNDSANCSADYINTKIQPNTTKKIQSNDKTRVGETKIHKYISGDAEVYFEEGNGERKITIKHNGITSEYKL